MSSLLSVRVYIRFGYFVVVVVVVVDDIFNYLSNMSDSIKSGRGGGG